MRGRPGSCRQHRHRHEALERESAGQPQRRGEVNRAARLLSPTPACRHSLGYPGGKHLIDPHIMTMKVIVTVRGNFAMLQAISEQNGFESSQGRAFD
jgi:hypothetical protein